MEEINKRLDILLDAGQIQKDSYDLAYKTIDILKEELNKEDISDKDVMLITHLVMANERMKKKENIQALDLAIVEQLNKNKNIDKANSIANKIQKLIGDKFVENEKKYIVMHLLNVVGE